MPTTPPFAASASIPPIRSASSAWRPVKAARSRGKARVAAAANAPGVSCLPGRQHLGGGGLAAGRRDEQGAHRPGQAQRTSQQPGGVLMRGGVDAPLQVTDRPRAHARRLRQFLLGQPRLGPQLPQQPGERKRLLVRHHPHAPHSPARGHRPSAGTTLPPHSTQARPPPPSQLPGQPRPPRCGRAIRARAQRRSSPRPGASDLRGRLRGPLRVVNPPAGRDGGTSPLPSGPHPRAVARIHTTPQEAIMNPIRTIRRLACTWPGWPPPHWPSPPPRPPRWPARYHPTCARPKSCPPPPSTPSWSAACPAGRSPSSQSQPRPSPPCWHCSSPGHGQRGGTRWHQPPDPCLQLPGRATPSHGRAARSRSSTPATLPPKRLPAHAPQHPASKLEAHAMAEHAPNWTICTRSPPGQPSHQPAHNRRSGAVVGQRMHISDGPGGDLA